jgi:hypothetical protein
MALTWSRAPAEGRGSLDGPGDGPGECGGAPGRLSRGVELQQRAEDTRIKSDMHLESEEEFLVGSQLKWSRVCKAPAEGRGLSLTPG